MSKPLCFTVAALLFSSQAFAVATVAHVDLSRYVGKWYEVASIPAWFQKKCIKNTTAEYKSSGSGRVEVINSCEKSNGSLDVAKGIARVVNEQSQAELKVSFVPFFKIFGWFSGQYKVIALGENYEYSLVGDDTLEYGWILSRTSSLPLATLKLLEKKISSAGYDSCKFLTSVQDGTSSVERTPLCNVAR